MTTNTFKKAKPNDPCPCGSGTKFKKCHGMCTPTGPSSAPEPTKKQSADVVEAKAQGAYVVGEKPWTKDDPNSFVHTGW